MNKAARIAALKEERDAILKTLEGEKRETATPAEANRLQEIYNEIATLRAQMQRDGELTPAPTPAPTEERASLTQVLRELSAGKLSEGAHAVLARGAEQMREAQISTKGASLPMDMLTESSAALTVGGTGGKTVSTEIQPILAPLYGELVFAKAGARILTGLKGNLSFPRYSGTTSNWAGETDAATAGEGTIDQVTFSPKRLTTIVELSEQLLLQDDAGVEAMIQREIIQSIRAKLEATALGKEDSGSGKRPVGLFNGSVANKGAATHARLVGMETRVAESNALLGNLAYITSPKGAEVLRTTHKDKAGVQFLSEDGKTLGGYNLFVSNGVAKEVNAGEQAILFGNFNDFVLAQWGGFNIVVDNITKAAEGTVRFVISTWHDFGFIRPESVQKATIK